MREPAFWWRPGRGGFLSPLAGIYGAVAARRMNSPGRSVGVPVICLGNLTVGGAGKTPAAIAVAQVLLAAHAHPYFLSRGYGGRLRVRCGSMRRCIPPPTSATSRYCWRGSRRPSSRATASTAR